MKLKQAVWWTVYFTSALLMAMVITAMLTEAKAQITPEWRGSDVLKGPKSPSPADVFRHHCRPGFKYSVRYHRCLPNWQDRRRRGR